MNVNNKLIKCVDGIRIGSTRSFSTEHIGKWSVYDNTGFLPSYIRIESGTTTSKRIQLRCLSNVENIGKRFTVELTVDDIIEKVKVEVEVLSLA